MKSPFVRAYGLLTRYRTGILLLALAALAGCSDYGTRLEFNGGELFYTEKVTEAEANKLGNYLVQQGFFDGEEKSMQLTRENETYQFRMVVKDGLENDADLKANGQIFAAQLSTDVFNNAPVEVHFTDSHLETLTVITSDPNTSAAQPNMDDAANESGGADGQMEEGGMSTGDGNEGDGAEGAPSGN